MWAPAEWPKTIIVAGSPPYSAACARANATAQAPWDWYARCRTSSDGGQAAPQVGEKTTKPRSATLRACSRQVALAALKPWNITTTGHGPALAGA